MHLDSTGGAICWMLFFSFLTCFVQLLKLELSLVFPVLYDLCLLFSILFCSCFFNSVFLLVFSSCFFPLLSGSMWRNKKGGHCQIINLHIFYHYSCLLLLLNNHKLYLTLKSTMFSIFFKCL